MFVLCRCFVVQWKHQQPSALNGCWISTNLLYSSHLHKGLLQSEQRGKCKQLFNASPCTDHVISLCGTGLDREEQVCWLTVKNNEMNAWFTLHKIRIWMCQPLIVIITNNGINNSHHRHAICFRCCLRVDFMLQELIGWVSLKLGWRL